MFVFFIHRLGRHCCRPAGICVCCVCVRACLWDCFEATRTKKNTHTRAHVHTFHTLLLKRHEGVYVRTCGSHALFRFSRTHTHTRRQSDVQSVVQSVVIYARAQRARQVSAGTTRHTHTHRIRSLGLDKVLPSVGRELACLRKRLGPKGHTRITQTPRPMSRTPCPKTCPIHSWRALGTTATHGMRVMRTLLMEHAP